MSLKMTTREGTLNSNQTIFQGKLRWWPCSFVHKKVGIGEGELLPESIVLHGAETFSKKLVSKAPCDWTETLFSDMFDHYERT